MNTTLVASFWPRSQASWLFKTLLALAGTLAMAVSAHVKVPFWPVPMTMQTFVVLAIGAAFGARLAGATLLAYLAQGAVGLPVFAGGAGLAYLAGPTGGYLVGFLLAACLVGWLADRGFGRSLPTALAAFLAGEAVMLGLGVAWLATLIGGAAALQAGLVPFLLGEATKVALACALLPVLWRIARR